MGDHMQESKGPTIRCPICHYIAKRDKAEDAYTVYLIRAWRCLSSASHLFYLPLDTTQAEVVD